MLTQSREHCDWDVRIKADKHICDTSRSFGIITQLLHQKDQKVIHMQSSVAVHQTLLLVRETDLLLVEQKGFHVTTNERNHLIKAKPVKTLRLVFLL